MITKIITAVVLFGAFAALSGSSSITARAADTKECKCACACCKTCTGPANCCCGGGCCK